MTAEDLKELGLIDGIIPEPPAAPMRIPMARRRISVLHFIRRSTS